MPRPQGVSLEIPQVAVSASSSRTAGRTCTSLLPLELYAEARPPALLLVFRGGLVLLDELFSLHPWGWSVIR